MGNKKELNGKTKASLVKNFFRVFFSDFLKTSCNSKRERERNRMREREKEASNHYEGIQASKNVQIMLKE